MRYQIGIEDQTVEVEIERTATGWRIRRDEEWTEITGNLRDGMLRLAGQRPTPVHVQGTEVLLQHRGGAYRAVAVDPRNAAAVGGGGVAQGEIRTPMPGVVVRIPVSVGQAVTAGQVVIVVEAMKMENEFKSAIDGTVVEIPVVTGQTLDSNTLLARIE